MNRSVWLEINKKKGCQGFYSKLALSLGFLYCRYHKNYLNMVLRILNRSLLKEEYYQNFQYNCLDLCPNGADGLRCYFCVNCRMHKLTISFS